MTVIKGYLRSSDDGSALYDAMRRLVSVGVNSDMIYSGNTPAAVIDSLSRGDRLVVCSLYDLANGLPSLMRLLGRLACKGVDLQSLDETWFRMTDGRTDWASLFDGLAEFGSRAVSTRTRSALSDAVSAGRKLGRPVGSISSEQAEKYKRGLEMYRKGASTASIARELQMSRSSFMRWIDGYHPEVKRKRMQRSSIKNIHR